VAPPVNQITEIDWLRGAQLPVVAIQIRMRKLARASRDKKRTDFYDFRQALSDSTRLRLLLRFSRRCHYLINSVKACLFKEAYRSFERRSQGKTKKKNGEHNGSPFISHLL